MLAWGDSAALAGAGVAAGVIGTSGGITTLVSYPALVGVGLPARSAAIANTVAIVACWPGAWLASRAELRESGGVPVRWYALTAAGAAVGAALLIATPPHAFLGVVPFLLLGAAAAVLAQPYLPRGRARRARALLLVSVFALALYNSYFGAGSGILLLVVLMLTVDGRLPAANALKNMLVGMACLVGAAAFVVAAPVDAAAVGPLAAGLFAGSLVGPRVARRVPAAPLRVLVALTGVALAADLWAGGG